MPGGTVADRTQAGPQRAPVLPVHEPTDKGVGFRAGEVAVGDRRVQSHARVSDADAPRRVVEFALVGGRAQALSLALRDSPGFHIRSSPRGGGPAAPTPSRSARPWGATLSIHSVAVKLMCLLKRRSV